MLLTNRVKTLAIRQWVDHSQIITKSFCNHRLAPERVVLEWCAGLQRTSMGSGGTSADLGTRRTTCAPPGSLEVTAMPLGSQHIHAFKTALDAKTGFRRFAEKEMDNVLLERGAA
jgi:hypothetical protein